MHNYYVQNDSYKETENHIEKKLRSFSNPLRYSFYGNYLQNTFKENESTHIRTFNPNLNLTFFEN